jgi:hypothetical protein
VHEYVDAFNRYAATEAELLDRHGVKGSAAKIVYRPVLRFLWCFVWKRTFRLGARGAAWSGAKAVGEFARYAKLWERQNAAKMIDPPPSIEFEPVGNARASQPVTGDASPR